jgi:hypothetical protein
MLPSISSDYLLKQHLPVDLYSRSVIRFLWGTNSNSSSPQRGRPIDTRPQISDSSIPTGNNIWLQVPQGCSIPRHTDWLAVSRKVVLTLTLTWLKKTNGKPDLSSERAPTESNIWSQVPEWALLLCYTDWLTDRPSVITWLRLLLKMIIGIY